MAARTHLTLTAVMAASLASVGIPAHAAGPQCSLYDSLQMANPAFRLAKVTGAGHVALAPADGAPGTSSPYLVAGDDVIVLVTDAARSCVAFTAPTKAARTTVGWVATAALDPVIPPPDGAADWIGEWHSGPEQTVRMQRQGQQIHVTGDATYGATDPDRVKRGGVNLGSLDGMITPSGGHADYSEGDDTACHVKFRKLGAYLIASDNGNCGGHNVSFSGSYRTAAGRRN